MSTPEPKKFFLQKSNKFLDANDEFKAGGFMEKTAKAFDTEAAALDKAEAMGLDLDAIYVVAGKVRPVAP